MRVRIFSGVEMCQFAIRRATPVDANAATDVIRAAYAPWMARLADLPDVTSGVAEEIASEEVWVAHWGEKIVGYLSARFAADHVHIANLAVHPKAAGRGIGTGLMAEVTKDARHRGLAVMRLATHEAMVGNVAFYTRLGWHETGSEGRKVVMERHLSPQ